MLEILAVLLVVGVFVYGWYRNDLRRLTRDYACKEPFDGALEHCIVRFPVDETGTDCMLGANRDGLYLSSSVEALEKNRRWSWRYYVTRTPILIPWSCIQISDAKFRCEDTFDSVCQQIRPLFLFLERSAGCF